MDHPGDGETNLIRERTQMPREPDQSFSRFALRLSFSLNLQNILLTTYFKQTWLNQVALNTDLITECLKHCNQLYFPYYGIYKYTIYSAFIPICYITLLPQSVHAAEGLNSEAHHRRCKSWGYWCLQLHRHRGRHPFLLVISTSSLRLVEPLCYILLLTLWVSVSMGK